MSGPTAFDLRPRSGLAVISRSHREIIRRLVEESPDASLSDIADLANSTNALQTCSMKITVDILRELGYQEPVPSVSEPSDSADTPERQRGQLTPGAIRSQLEKRHDSLQTRIDGMLSSEETTDRHIKALKAFMDMDDKITDKLLELMNEEGAPLLPLSIIVFCLRQHGVAEDDIDFITTEVLVA